MKNEFREEALRLIEFDKKKPIYVKKKDGSMSAICFARATEEDLDEIEKMSDEEIMEIALSYCFVIGVECAGIVDIQFRTFFLFEIEERGLLDVFKPRYDEMMLDVEEYVNEKKSLNKS